MPNTAVGLSFGQILDRVHRTCGRSALARRFALKLRNQCDRIVAASVSDGIDLRSNGELWLIERLSPNLKCFVDVGANVGEWTKAVLARNKCISGTCFEPSPSASAELFKSAIEWPTVRVVPKAVSDREGSLKFRELGQAAQTSGAASIVGSANGVGVVVDVPAVTLDDELERIGVRDVDILKVDAEGMDWRVLCGAANLLSEGRIRVVQFEYGDGWVRSGGTLWWSVAWLESRGYAVKRLMSNGLSPLDLEALGEHFAYSNYVAIRVGDKRTMDALACDAAISERSRWDEPSAVGDGV